MDSAPSRSRTRIAKLASRRGKNPKGAKASTPAAALTKANIVACQPARPRRNAPARPKAEAIIRRSRLPWREDELAVECAGAARVLDRLPKPRIRNPKAGR